MPLMFSYEKDSAVSFPRDREVEFHVLTIIYRSPLVGHFYFYFYFILFFSEEKFQLPGFELRPNVSEGYEVTN